ncbi:hypothetical protein BGX38DRAFT_1152212, partial [Terfezia claveryi]
TEMLSYASIDPELFIATRFTNGSSLSVQTLILPQKSSRRKCRRQLGIMIYLSWACQITPVLLFCLQMLLS